MDVLHFMKSTHDDIRHQLSQLEEAGPGRERRRVLDELARDLLVHIVLERDYLYPELGGLFSGVEAMVAGGQANVATIDKRLKLLQKLFAAPGTQEQETFNQRLAELKAAVLAHFEQEEQVLMPKMRATIRTEEREDLGQVFMDVRDEVREAVLQPAPAAASGRKRA